MVDFFDIEQICLRAKGLEPGPVAPEEVEFARNLLRGREGDIVGAIYVVGLSGNKGDAALLESYLHGDENNIYAEYALKALCCYLGLVDRYRPLLRLWMQETELDGDRRMAAIQLAAEYFAGFEDNELGRYLVDVLCNLEDSCRRSVRSVFVNILDLTNQLEDPYGTAFDDWDEDTTLIVQTAAQKFGYRDLKILHRRALN
ncbi:hypothetical protein [Labrenzia sp. VG12]|uniref:hypothetical protein n=1 Tax=Labrenzia sp. VG12 TaxID=2021862 RepID=UPI000B8C2CB2|nr:hypothetical protein [Labrenzia sp. VG12]ASP35491.1 hypothetical protein CHH27_21460 [Labrenzia sp. VG12]